MTARSLARIALMAFAPLVASAPAFAATNLLTNGSFETYNSTAGTFGGWTNATSGKPVQQSTSATGNDPFTASPDAAGTNAAFFSDNNATETLTQSINVVAGTQYLVGFDLFKTSAGASSPLGFTVSATVGGNTITSASSTTLPAATWTHYVASFIASTTATVTYALTFASASGTGATQDTLVDLAYVAATVSEPASFALLAAGLAGIYMVRRRQQA